LYNVEYKQFEDYFNNFIKRWWETGPWKNDQNSLKGVLEFLLKRINEFDAKLSEQKKEIEQLKRQLNTQQQSSKSSDYSTSIIKNNQQDIVSSSDKTIDLFNTWSKNPRSLLPFQYNYAEGDLKLREKQKILSSSSKNATWIINKSGPVKYIFPNPEAIDQLSGKIDVLYTVTGNRRARGQNKVIIQNACVIMEDGWIEYKGELNLL